MNARHALLLKTVLAVGAALSATPLLAQVPSLPVPGSGGAPVKPGLSPIAQAQKAVQEAQAQVNVAKTGSTAARAKIEQKFKGRPDWAAAELELNKSKQAHGAAVRAALAARRAQPDYKAAAAGKTAAEEKQRALNETGRATAEQLGAVGDDLVRHATDVRRMEGEATADPKIAAAKVRYDAAVKQMAVLRQEVESMALTDPDCMVADQNFAAAQVALKSAQENLRTTQKSEAEAAKARRTTPSPSPSSSPPPRLPR